MTFHDIKDRTPNPALVEQLEMMLEKARAGAIRSMLGVYEWDDASVSNGWSIDPRSNRRMLLAEIAVCQADFIVNIGLEDGVTVLAKALSS